LVNPAAGLSGVLPAAAKKTAAKLKVIPTSVEIEWQFLAFITIFHSQGRRFLSDWRFLRPMFN
jgi:hypothetical protein